MARSKKNTLRVCKLAGPVTMQKPIELARLVDLLAVENCRSVVEIGSCYGGVLWACAQALPSAYLLGVDIEQPTPGTWCDWIVGDSHEEDTLRRIIQKSVKFDAVIIDGDHSYKGVRQDWEIYQTLLPSGGLLAFHDVCRHPPEANCHVSELWDELLTIESNIIEIIEPPNNWGGFGVVRR